MIVDARVERAPLRLLYLMHIDWNWIRQRPQALTEELDRLDGFDVRVAYLPNWRRRRLSRNASTVRRTPLLQLPLARLSAIHGLNARVGRIHLRMLARSWQPDAIVLTHAWMYELPPRRLATKPLFYDCMDLAVGFEPDPIRRQKTELTEARLLGRVKGVFVSSSYLESFIRRQIPPGVEITLVRNAIDGTFETLPSPPPDPDGIVRIAFFGTVAWWFDWALMTRVLNLDHRLELHVWGPVQDAVPHLDRLYLHGVVPRHRDIPGAIRGMDALILPFAVNDLVRAIDPVKLYEYVALGLPALSVYYPELEQFRGLVSFYSDEDSLLALVRTLRVNPGSLRPDQDRARPFLADATWRNRARLIAGAILGSLREDTSVG